MFTSYIIDKAGFTLLCALIGGNGINIPKRLCESITDSNYENVMKRLSETGYIYSSGERVSVERTIHFLVSSIINAVSVSEENDGKRYIFRCSKLIVIIEEDRLSSRKCRMIPIKDDDMLEEYYRELDETCYYEEE